MSTETPEILVTRTLRDSARTLRGIAVSADVAELALREERKFDRRLAELESKRDLAMAGELELKLEGGAA